MSRWGWKKKEKKEPNIELIEMHEKERRLGEFCGREAAWRARLVSAELMVRVITPLQSHFLPRLLTKRQKRPFEIGISGQGVRGSKLRVGSPHYQ